MAREFTFITRAKSRADSTSKLLQNPCHLRSNWSTESEPTRAIPVQIRTLTRAKMTRAYPIPSRAYTVHFSYRVVELREFWYNSGSIGPN